jgi:hypothetical protein
MTLENLIGGADKQALKLAKLMARDAKQYAKQQAKTMKIVAKDERIMRRGY